MTREAMFPPRLRPGDEVALVAPGGAVEPGRVQGAVEALEARGLRVRVRDDVAARCRYLAGDDRRRAAELREALEDPGVRAVWCLRGGYGVQRILGTLPPEPPGPPKAVVGFSDNTALLWFLRERWGWAVVHGPHPRADDPEGLDGVLACLGYYGEPARTAARGLRLWSPGGWEPVVAEVGGGCLSLVAASAGTPFPVRLGGCVAFLEDVAEPVYRIDRMLLQVRASGALEGARALVLGRLEAFLAPGERLGPLEDLVAELARDLPIPVLSGLSCGHCTPNLPLPFGPRARLDPGAGVIAFTEGAVR